MMKTLILKKFGPLWILLMSSLFLSSVFAESSASEKEAEMRMTMHSFYASFIKLKPYLISYDSFQNPNEKEKVKVLLSDMQEKISSSKPKTLSESRGFDVTYGVVEKHIKDIVKLYDRGHYQIAWNKLNATPSLCIACHNRLPKPSSIGKFALPDFNSQKISNSHLQDAEFYFLSHNFDLALNIYDQAIQSYKNVEAKESDIKNGLKNDLQIDLRKIYERKLIYFARIARDPSQAIENLNLDLKNKELPPPIKENIRNWIRYFQKWKTLGANNPANFNDEKLIKYARGLIEKYTGAQKINWADPYLIDLLRVSGLLYERIYKLKSTPAVAEMLYLLGKCEKDLESFQIYSLAEIYWRECVLAFPKNPIAKKCYSALELELRPRYKGTDTLQLEGELQSLKKKME